MMAIQPTVSLRRILFPWLILSLAACASIDGLEEPLDIDENEIVELTEGLRDVDFDFSALRIHRTINHLGQETNTTVRLYRRGSIIRYDYVEAIDRSESSIFDFEKKKEFKIFDGDHMFFELTLPETVSERAQREGLLPLEPDPKINVNRYLLGEMEIEGHPCEIILQVRTLKGKPTYVAEYTFLFEALDLNRQPLRVAYNPTKRVLTLIEYQNPSDTSIEPARFQVPEDFANFTPY